jgi:Maltose operon periplasmic protein precursor (MalM)
MIKSISIGLVLLTALLAGCQTTERKQTTSMLQAEKTLAVATKVSSLSELPVNTLLLDAPNQFFLGESPEKTDSAWVRPNQPDTFVRVFRLPTWQDPYSIELSSFVRGDLIAPSLFYPKLLMLNKDFQVTRESQASDFRFRIDATQGYIANNLFVNEENKQETYIAIIGEPKASRVEQLSNVQSQGSFPVAAPIGPFIFVWHIRTGGSEQATTMKATESGPLRLVIKQYKPKKVGER